MRVLLVDQDCAQGHVAFNRLVIEELRAAYEVTVATSPEYGTRLGEDSVLDLPGASGRGDPPARRLLGIPAVGRALQRYGQRAECVVFLGFDPLLLPWVCRGLSRDTRIVAIVHNQLRFRHGSFRGRYFTATGERVTYVGLEEHVTRFIGETLRIPAATVPHPYFQKEPVDPGVSIDAGLVFAPSRSNDPTVVEECANLLPAGWRIEARMPRPPSSSRISLLGGEIPDYHHRLASARCVLVAARMGHRVSGVAYEAMGMGRPVLLPDAPFTAELRRQYPGFVSVLESVADLASVGPVPEGERERFSREHSPAAFGTRLRAVVEGKPPGEADTG